MQRFGGGILLAISLMVGATLGILNGQPSLGLIAGLVLGVVGAGLIALRDMRRR